MIEGPVIVWDALNARRLYIQLTVNCRQRKLTGTAVHIPYSQSSAGDLRVQLYRCTVPEFISSLFQWYMSGGSAARVNLQKWKLHLHVVIDEAGFVPVEY